MRYILELKNSKSFWQEESKKMKKVIEREEIQFGRFVEKILDGCKEVML